MRISEIFTDYELLELTMADKQTVFDFISGIAAGNTVYKYRSVEEFGAASDRKHKRADETDEAFGLSLLGAYKAGQSDEAVFKFRNGSVAKVKVPKR